MTIRHCFATIVCLVFAALMLVPAAYAEEYDSEQASKRFTVAALTPEVFDDAGPLKIRTVLDQAPALDSTWQVEVFLDPIPFTSSDEITHYVEGDAFPGWQVSSQDVTSADVSTNSSNSNDNSVAIETTVPQDALPSLAPAASGPRGIAVVLHTESETFEARSVLIYNPPAADGYPRTNINAVVHLDQTFDNWAALEPIRDNSGVSLSMSASLLAANCAKRPLFSNPIQVVTTPGYDADISLMAAIDNSSLLDLTKSARSISDSELEKACPSVRVISNAVFASAAGFVKQSLPQLEGNTVVAPEEWSNANQEDALVTPTARVLISPVDGETVVDGVASDQPITVLDDWTDADRLLSAPLGSESAELLTRQMLRSAAINVGLETPEDIRTLLARVTIPADATVTDTDNYIARISALTSGDWVAPVTFEQVASSEPSTVSRTTVPEGNQSDLDATAKILEPLGATYQLSSGIASASPLGPHLLVPYLPALLRPTATGLSDPNREQLVSVAEQDLSAITQAVEIVPIGTVNLLNKTANFPVSIVNNSDVQLSLVVSLQPSDPRLQSRKEQYVTLPAQSQQEITLPVTAVGSGDVGVKAEVKTASGIDIATSNEASVRVRANWEDTGTLVFAIVLCVFFAFGVVRTVKRNRREQNAEGVEGKNE